MLAQVPHPTVIKIQSLSTLDIIKSVCGTKDKILRNVNLLINDLAANLHIGKTAVVSE